MAMSRFQSSRRTERSSPFYLSSPRPQANTLWLLIGYHLDAETRNPTLLFFGSNDGLILAVNLSYAYQWVHMYTTDPEGPPSSYRPVWT